jgi:Leucine-rich repeat (LRR) protein
VNTLQVPKALHNLEAIQTLDLSSNVIGFLKLESLQGLPKLRTLKLARNEISRVGKDAFREVRNLLHLDLSGNRLQTLDQETFKSVSDLQALNLAENQLEDINGLLHTQINLKWVNVSYNRLAWFDYAFFPPGLQYLDVRANRFDALGNYYNLLDNYDLRYLDAGGNRISSLSPTSLLQSLEDVILSENRISHIAANTFLGKNKLRQVHLDRNDLSSLERASLMVSTYNGKSFLCSLIVL